MTFSTARSGVGVASTGTPRMTRREWAFVSPCRRSSRLPSNSVHKVSGLVFNGPCRRSSTVFSSGKSIWNYKGLDDDAVHLKVPERDFIGTPYVPVYVMLPLNVIGMNCQLVDRHGLTNDLKALKLAGVNGVKVNCWWGIVEGDAPQVYNWSGYKELFKIIRDIGLKLQVVLSFHECGGDGRNDVFLPLPRWVIEIGETNPDIYFTDRHGRRNSDCITWGVDDEPIFQGRTALEVYFDYMRSFREECDDFFWGGLLISEIEVGLGPCGELRYPSFPTKHGWIYPGIGEFQCYDKYLVKSLAKAAEIKGIAQWAIAPWNAGSYNSTPDETEFFHDICPWNGGFYNSTPDETEFFYHKGVFDSTYGRFFLDWYSRVLIDHGDRVLALANVAFKGTKISAKLSGIHWCYGTNSHAAELTAGYYNVNQHNGYRPIAAMLKEHGVTLKFPCFELRTDRSEGNAVTDPEGLLWQVQNAVWDLSLPIGGENTFPCYDRESYNKILEHAKPLNIVDVRDSGAASSFTYVRLNSVLTERRNFEEFSRFVKRMHGQPY